MFLNRTHMAPRGSMSPNVSDPLISRRRPTSAPAVSPLPTPLPPPPPRPRPRRVQGLFKGDCGVMQLVSGSAAEGFCLDGSAYEPAPGVFSLRFQFRQTCFQQADKPRTRNTRRTETPRAPRNKTKGGGEKKIKTPCATRHDTMFPPLLPRVLSYSWALRM